MENKYKIVIVVALLMIVGLIGLLVGDVIDTTLMEGYIGKEKAIEIAKETSGVSHDTDYSNAKLIDYNGIKVYKVYFGWNGGSQLHALVDAKTGERVE